jgi:hypothetical protein
MLLLRVMLLSLLLSSSVLVLLLKWAVLTLPRGRSHPGCHWISSAACSPDFGRGGTCPPICSRARRPLTAAPTGKGGASHHHLGRGAGTKSFGIDGGSQAGAQRERRSHMLICRFLWSHDSTAWTKTILQAYYPHAQPPPLVSHKGKVVCCLD